MITTIGGIVGVLFVITAGLTAGLFWAYSYSVMPALADVDDRTYVTVMNKINIVILNPWFAFCFAGGAVFGIIAVIIGLTDRGPDLPWTAAALVIYVVALIITFVVHIPINNALAKVDPATGDAGTVATARRSEQRWTRGNHLRAAVHTLAFLAACCALLVR